MDIIDNMLAQMVWILRYHIEFSSNTEIGHNHSFPHVLFSPQLQDDALFKPSGGKLGENDMDFDTDNKTMATLRRQLRRAHEEYYRRKRYDVQEAITCSYLLSCGFSTPKKTVRETPPPWFCPHVLPAEPRARAPTRGASC
jgi:hypothetical protein